MEPRTNLTPAEERLTTTLGQNIAREKAAIHAEIELLHRELEQAHQLMSSVEDSVFPVSNGAQTAGGVLDHEAIGNSPIYGALHEATVRVRALQSRLQSVLANLEV